MSITRKIPGYNKCPHCGEWSYEMDDDLHTCKPLWLAIVLPADASERDITIAITEADNTDGWDKVYATLGSVAASQAAELAWDGDQPLVNKLVVLREAAKPDATLLFDITVGIRPEFYARQRKVQS